MLPTVHVCLADIKYGSLLEIDETLKKMRTSGPKAGEAMLVEEVGPEEIAGVVSKWTGTCVEGNCQPPFWGTGLGTGLARTVGVDVACQQCTSADAAIRMLTAA